MNKNAPWATLSRGLLDTGIIIRWHRGDVDARHCLRQTETDWYYARMTRKELLHPPIRDAEKRKLLALLATMRIINPDDEIAEAYTDLLQRYPYLRDHLADALIAATAWVKGLPVVTTNVRHFVPIEGIEVISFP